MKDVRSLTRKLKPLLGWHQSRIECLAHIMINLIATGSVNLTTIAECMSGKAQIGSNHKRLKRFFRRHDFCLNQVARLIVTWMAPTNQWILCLDRTNWKIGKKPVNILMLGIAVRGIAIPVMWTLLPHEGNSNTGQRIALITRFIRLFGSERIAYLTADREFKGGDWLKWLKKQGIHWRIRIPNNTLIPNQHANKKLPAMRLFSVQVGERLHLNKPRTVWGVKVFVSAHRSAQERIIVISDEKAQDILADYMTRWGIETLFQCFKGRGFNLEDTRLSEEQRLSRLLAVMAMSFCWCFDTGIWQQVKKPVKRLKHGRLSMSLFRSSLSLLRNLIRSPAEKGGKLAFFIKRICPDGIKDPALALRGIE